MWSEQWLLLLAVPANAIAGDAAVDAADIAAVSADAVTGDASAEM